MVLVVRGNRVTRHLDSRPQSFEKGDFEPLRGQQDTVRLIKLRERCMFRTIRGAPLRSEEEIC